MRREGNEALKLRNKGIEIDAKHWEQEAKEQAQRVRPGEELEAIQFRATQENERRMQRAQEQADLEAAFLEQQQAKRIRPGEEIDALQFRATQENEKRIRKEAEDRAQEAERAAKNEVAQIRAGEAAERRADGERRQGAFDAFLLSGALTGAGGVAMGFTNSNLNAFSERQMAESGAKSAFGAEADSVVASARKTAPEVYGADESDLIRLETLLKRSGVQTKDVQKDILSISDALADSGRMEDGALNRLVINLGQIRNSLKLRRTDLNQLDLAGLPGSSGLAAGLGISQAELQERMGRGEVSGKDAYEAIVKYFEKQSGGRGKELTETTLEGQRQQLSEEWKQFSALMGQGVAPALGLVNRGALSLINTVERSPWLAEALGVGGAVAGTGLLAGGAIFGAKAAGNVASNVFPGLQGDKDSGLRSFFFGGSAAQRAATTQLTAAETFSAAVNRFALTGGGGGPGGVGQTLATVGEEGLEAAAKIPWYARSAINPAGAVGGALTNVAAGGGPLARYAGNALALDAGGAAVGAGLGALAGYGVSDDLKSLGYSNGASDAAGGGLGIAAGVAAMFVPEGAIAIAIATGFRTLFNEAINRPMERAAENGTGIDEDKLKAAGSDFNKQADNLFAQADIAAANGDQTTAQSLRLSAALRVSEAKRNQIQIRQQQDGASFDALVASNRRAPTPDDYQGDLSTMRNKEGRIVEAKQVRDNEDGSQTVIIQLPMHRQTGRIVRGLDEATRG